MDLIMSTTQGHMACILNTIPNFHVLEGCVPDIMHIFLEGVCRLILKVLLIYIICTQRYISIEIFNSRLSALDFGHCDSTNIPTPLKVLRSDERWCHSIHHGTSVFVKDNTGYDRAAS